MNKHVYCSEHTKPHALQAQTLCCYLLCQQQVQERRGRWATARSCCNRGCSLVSCCNWNLTYQQAGTPSFWPQSTAVCLGSCCCFCCVQHASVTCQQHAKAGTHCCCCCCCRILCGLQLDTAMLLLLPCHACQHLLQQGGISTLHPVLLLPANWVDMQQPPVILLLLLYQHERQCLLQNSTRCCCCCRWRSVGRVHRRCCCGMTALLSCCVANMRCSAAHNAVLQASPRCCAAAAAVVEDPVCWHHMSCCCTSMRCSLLQKSACCCAAAAAAENSVCWVHRRCLAGLGANLAAQALVAFQGVGVRVAALQVLGLEIKYLALHIL